MRRLIQSIPTFLGVTILVFSIMSIVPGGFVTLLFFGNPDVTLEDRELLEDKLGLNDPLPVQYLRWLLGDDWLVAERAAPFARLANTWMAVLSDDAVQLVYTDEKFIDERYGNSRGIIRGDFGKSFRTNRSALASVVELIPASLELGVASLLVGLLSGIPIGIVAAILKGAFFDNASRVMAVFLNAIPNFWLGLMLLLIFSYQLGVFPTGDRYDIQARAQAIMEAGGDASQVDIPPIWERIEYLILPVIVLSASGLANNSRLMRTTTLDTVNQDYVRTAIAKGLPMRVVWLKHAVRNSLIPIAVGLGPALLFIWGGAVVTEAIFSWPGLGRRFITSLNERDWPIVLTIVVFSTIATILGYILSDVFVAAVDPRVRFE